MSRRGSRPHQARIDVHCWRHRKRVLLLTADIREPARLFGRLPGRKTAQIPAGVRELPVRCPLGCAETLDLATVRRAMASRIELFAPRPPNDFPWPIDRLRGLVA